MYSNCKAGLIYYKAALLNLYKLKSFAESIVFVSCPSILFRTESERAEGAKGEF